MEVRVDTMRAKVLNATQEELEWLDDYLCFEGSAFVRTKKGRTIRKADPYQHMLDKRNNTFPAGLVGMVKAACAREKYELNLHDGRTAPCEFDYNADLEWLHDYQFQCVWTCFEEHRGICQLPTAAGKGEIIVGLAMALPCHWVFAVDDTVLVKDIAERWERETGHPAGFVGDGVFNPDPRRRFTACTFQTLALGLRGRKAGKKRKEIPPNPQVKALMADAEGLLIDECHVVPAKTFMSVCMAARRAYFRLGFSATPLERGDKKSVQTVAALGPIIFKVEEKFLVERGVLAKAKIRMVAFPQECAAENWQGAYSQLIVNSNARNALVVKMAMRAAKPALVFVKEIEHGATLTKALNRFGVRSEFVWGDKQTPQREAAIKRLRYGELDAIVCSVVFQKGIDIPELEAVVNAAGMKTTIGALQRMGRGMRSNQGKKTTFELWDVKDEGNGFMVRHTRNRMKAYRSRGHDIEVLQEEDV